MGWDDEHRDPNAKKITFDGMTRRAQYEWQRAEDAEAEAKALHERIEQLERDLFVRTAQPVGVRVKPLEWEAREDDPDAIVAGDYEIIHETHGYQLYFWSVILGDEHKNRADAEAAAWEHHQKRILSALLPEGGAI